ncbi:unnamed protein product [Rotaria sp. Silwood2]|nr:unnamed protein product [Rotaria sp. Silwood2]CAF2965169.1 unnamed protein product [Rotaria sp. Silwood2]CAF3214565.1 unnamed protein product [Rotaria sp. Silwood2]CAF3985700.1 unnamed protein product [Rotaria sp. Silwood2]CAF4286082.1 unnamed protein product [Rotaria sp. Silwood2]
MAAAVDLEFLLNTIDEACQEWQQKFQTTTQELLQSIQQVLGVCVEYLIELSKSTADDEQSKQDRLGAKRIVFKLKQLKSSLGNLWPASITSFTRDRFDVDTYNVETIEFFEPVQFYPGFPYMMKLYEWSVYNTNGTLVYRYFLEKSELMGSGPYYVLGKAFSHGRSQIHSYGPTIPDYNQMKIHVISNLSGHGSQPLTTMTVPRFGPWLQ